MMNDLKTIGTARLSEQEPYSTKRHGLSLANCDAEPVQTPGCVQAHGALLVLRLSDLRILQATENCAAVLGQSAAELLGWSVSALIGLEGERKLRDILAVQATEHNSLYLLTLPAGLDVTVHTVDGVVVLEFESTGRADAVNHDHYALVKDTIVKLQSAASVQDLCDTVADEIRRVTGFDRVMVYKFHADHHGEVFSESRIAGLGSWLGLHYPAEDIPKPAREIFRKTWIRPIPDMTDQLAELHPLLNPDTGKPLNMTWCALRGASLMCTEYSRNMGVAATLTLSIRRDDTLWGLIVCHHYAGPKYLPYQVRAACEFLAQVVSLAHRTVEDKEHLAYRLRLEDVHRQIASAAAPTGDLGVVIHGKPSLMDGIDASGCALYHQGRWQCAGSTPSHAELQSLGDWLTAGPFAAGGVPLYASDSLVRDYPDAAAFTGVASGLMALPLSRRDSSMLLWFRCETLQTVNWGGNPTDKTVVGGPNGSRLTPRRSFELFAQSVSQRSLPWKPVELQAATQLCVLLFDAVLIRAERLHDLNAELARSQQEVEAFAYVASHDLKEPLRGIREYANQLVEDALLASDEYRHKLDRLQQLTLRMDGLLDSMLHYSSVGRADPKLEMVDMDAVLAEAAVMTAFRGVGSAIELVVPRGLVQVKGNRWWCREIYVNLLSNAMQYTDKARPRIEAGYIAAGESHPRPGCPTDSLAHTIYYLSDDGIGIQTSQFEQIFKMFKRLHGREDYAGGIGAGLTLVRKLVERHHGKVWLASKPGSGTTFYFTLPGELVG